MKEHGRTPVASASAHVTACPASPRLWARWAASLLLSLVAACGGGDDDEPGAAPVPEASATIGAAGGTLVGPDDVRLVVPAGALAVDTTLTIRRSAAGAPALPASAASAGGAPVMYEFTPHGLQFAVPATISMPSSLDPAIDPVLMAQPGQPWERVDATQSGGRISWPTAHFSWSYHYQCSASYPPGTPLPPNGPPGCHFPSAALTVAATPAAALTAMPSQLLYQYRVGAAADVAVTFRYTAPLDCINPVIRTGRVVAPQTINPATLPATAVTLVRTPVSRIPGAFELIGSTDFTFRFSHADNGVVRAGFYFACDGTLTAGGIAGFTVQVPVPPVAPAGPTITQQPASATVLAGATAAFDVLAAAPDNLVVRWERREPAGTAFVAATGAAPILGGSRLSLVTVAADTGAAYRAQVCNALSGQETCTTSTVATLTVTTPPPPLPVLSVPSRLSGATQSACGIAAGGGALCWGANGTGELGRGSTNPAEATPAAATGLTGVTSLGASSFIGCAVHGGGRLSCWGGYPGQGQFEQSRVPVELTGVTNARVVRVANGTFCHVDDDRRIRCSDVAGPLQIDGQPVDNAVDVAFAGAGRCVLLTSGEARCAVYDGSAALVTSLVVPMVRSLGGVPGYSGTGTPFCVALISGSVRCWGPNTNGQLGTGNTDMAVTDATVPGVANAVAVAVGTRHACALSSDGSVRCWGTGYLGTGAGVETAQAPRLVAGLNGIVEITAGFDTTCALRSSGEVLCWGDNAQGSMGSGTLGGAVLAPLGTVAGAAFAR